jgi:hypothetical protein
VTRFAASTRGRNPNQWIGPAIRFERLWAGAAQSILEQQGATPFMARSFPLKSEGEIMTIAPRGKALLDPDFRIRTGAIERRKLPTA